MKTYSISEVSKLLGLPASALRYYDSGGFIPSIHRDSNGRRVFTEEDLNLLAALRRAVDADMTLPEFRELYDAVIIRGSYSEGRELLVVKHQEIEEKISRLQEALRSLEKVMEVYDEYISRESISSNPEDHHSD